MSAVKERPVQISAIVSKETQQLLDEYSQETGIKKGRVIEAALRQHLLALMELPAEYIVPARIVLSPQEGKRVLALIDRPPPPTSAMKKLMRLHGHSTPKRK